MVVKQKFFFTYRKIIFLIPFLFFYLFLALVIFFNIENTTIGTKPSLNQNINQNSNKTTQTSQTTINNNYDSTNQITNQNSNETKINNQQKQNKSNNLKNQSDVLIEEIYQLIETNSAKLEMFQENINHELPEIQKLFSLLNKNKDKKVLLQHLANIKEILKKIIQNQVIEEIEELLVLTHDQCIAFLKIKYGDVLEPYFIKNTENNFIRNTNITKSKQGLTIHHILEKEEPGLSDLNCANNLPLEFQEGKNLVYCNLLEHFLLHLKIYDYYATLEKNEIGIKGAIKINTTLKNFFIKQNWDKSQKYINFQEEVIHKQKEYWIKCDVLLKSLKIRQKEQSTKQSIKKLKKGDTEKNKKKRKLTK